MDIVRGDSSTSGTKAGHSASAARGSGLPPDAQIRRDLSLHGASACTMSNLASLLWQFFRPSTFCSGTACSVPALGNPSRRRGGQAPPNRVRRAERWSARTHQPKSGQNLGGVGTWMVFLLGEEGASEVFASVLWVIGVSHGVSGRSFQHFESDLVTVQQQSCVGEN